MSIKFEVPPNIKDLLSDNERSLIPEIRKKFGQTNNLKNIKREILKDMIKGISPVNGAGKWQKYSESYKEQIRGRAAYRRLPNGRVIRISADQVGRGFKKGKQNLVDDLNSDFKKSQRPAKRISPVNLRLSGKLHRSLFVTTAGGIKKSFRLRIGFKNKLADIHNRQGAGKSKVVRRLLPTEFNESFNRRITSFIFDQLKKATEIVAKEFTRQ